MLHNYIISLKHAKERRMHIENEFNNKNISFQFFDAISSPEQLKTSTQKLLPLFNEVSYLTPGEKGCFMSHLSLWQHCLNQKLPYIAIFEDDILLGEQAEYFLNNDVWLQSPSLLNNPFVLRLETFYEACQIKPSSLSDIKEYKVNHLCSPHHGTGGYIISQSAIKLFFTYLHNTKLDDFTPIDVLMFDTFINHKFLNIYQLTPAICIQEDIFYPNNCKLPSQIESERSNKSQHKSNRTIPQKIKREYIRIRKQLICWKNFHIKYYIIPFK